MLQRLQSHKMTALAKATPLSCLNIVSKSNQSGTAYTTTVQPAYDDRRSSHATPGPTDVCWGTFDTQ